MRKTSKLDLYPKGYRSNWIQIQLLFYAIAQVGQPNYHHSVSITYLRSLINKEKQIVKL
jgi:hypothetical protein